MAAVVVLVVVSVAGGAKLVMPMMKEKRVDIEEHSEYLRTLLSILILYELVGGWLCRGVWVVVVVVGCGWGGADVETCGEE